MPEGERQPMNESRPSVTMYHNPRCSKSRQALNLLKESGIEPEIVEYLKTPPDAETLREVLRMLGLRPRELMRTKEKRYREMNLADMSLSEEDLIEAMVQNPILIERPIVIRGKQAALGRPPERVLEIV
jgi:arsenate reductase